MLLLPSKREWKSLFSEELVWVNLHVNQEEGQKDEKVMETRIQTLWSPGGHSSCSCRYPGEAWLFSAHEQTERFPKTAGAGCVRFVLSCSFLSHEIAGHFIFDFFILRRRCYTWNDASLFTDVCKYTRREVWTRFFCVAKYTWSLPL